MDGGSEWTAGLEELERLAECRLWRRVQPRSHAQFLPASVDRGLGKNVVILYSYRELCSFSWRPFRKHGPAGAIQLCNPLASGSAASSSSIDA